MTLYYYFSAKMAANLILKVKPEAWEPTFETLEGEVI